MYKKHKSGNGWISFGKKLNIYVTNYNIEGVQTNYAIHVWNQQMLTNEYLEENYEPCTKSEFMEAYNTVLELLKSDVI